MDDVIELRDREGFAGFEDFVIKASKAGINESTITSLIEGGALDEFAYNRRSMIESLDNKVINIIIEAEYEPKVLAEMEFVSCGTAFSSKCVLDDKGYFLHY